MHAGIVGRENGFHGNILTIHHWMSGLSAKIEKAGKIGECEEDCYKKECNEVDVNTFAIAHERNINSVC